MDEEHSLRIAKLRLPLPLEPAIFRALAADNADARHKRLTFAWELACRVMACSAWAVCAHLGLRSSELASHAAALDRGASFGRWVGVLRAARALLDAREEPAALGVAVPLRALDAPYADVPSFNALAERLRDLGPDRCPVAGRSAFDLLQSLPAYRNADAHGELPPGFRERSVAPLLDALLDLLERAPPCGVFSVVAVRKLERDEAGWHAGLVSLRGTHPVGYALSLERAAWEGLSRGGAYLYAEPDRFVPLEPFAAADDAAGEWRLGWLERRVRGLTLGYESHGAGGFNRAHSAEVHARAFARDDTPRGEDAPSETALSLAPYRGLLAYDEASAPMFFGREEEIARAVSRLESEPALLLCGASGSGKSSLLGAGIVPALRARAESGGGASVVLWMVPGAKPMDALRRALRDAGPATPAEASAWSREVSECLPAREHRPDGLAHLLRGLGAGGRTVILCVDQLEEACTLCADAVERDAFLDALTSAAQHDGARVIATARVDLLAGLMDHAGVRAWIESRLFPVAAMDRGRLSRVILSPLRGRKIELEPGLPEEILADVGDQPGSLALLSQVLATLWDTRGRFGFRLTRRGYDAAGRVSGALRVQADAALREAAGENDAARARWLDRLLLQLASVNDDGGFSRRRVRVQTLAEALGSRPDEVRAALEPFVGRRLLVTGATDGEGSALETVEVAHEALLTAWEHLEKLLRLQTEVLRVRQAVESAAAAWEHSGRRRELWSDATSRLARAEELRDTGLLQLTTTERLFLLHSRESVVRRQRLDRGAVAVFIALSIAAGVGWAGTIRAQRRLQDTLERERADALAAAEHRRAESAISAARDRATARGASASALARQPGYEKDALLAAIDAVSAPMPPGASLPAAALQGLVDAVELAGPLSFVLAGHTRALASAAFSPDGTRVVTAAADRTARVWDARSGRFLFALGHPDAVVTASFSGDGDSVLTVCADGRVRLWSARDGAARATLGGEDPPARAAMFSPTGRVVLALGDDDVARAYDVATGTPVYTLRGIDPRGAAFSPDGTRALTGGPSPALWESGRPLARLAARGAAVCASAFSNDGARVLTAAEDGSLALWDAHTGRAIGGQRAHEGAACAVGFSPDGTLAASGGEDHTVRIWDAHTLAPSRVLRGHEGPVRALAFAPDGEHLLSGGGDESPRFWDVRTGRAVLLEGHTGAVHHVSLSADGTRALTASHDQTARIWDVGPRAGMLRLDLGAPVQSARFSPDGARVVTGDDSGEVRVWNSRVGRSLETYQGSRAAVIAALFTPEGILAAGEDGVARRWPGGEAVYTAREAVLSAAVSPDGTRALFGSADASAALVELRTPFAAEFLRAGTEAVLSAAFSSDGTRWVTAGGDGAAHVGRVGNTAADVTFEGHTGWVYRAEFSADGARLVTAGGDRTARVWDARSGALLRTLEPGAGQVFAATFSPDGARVLAADAAREARVYDVGTGALLWRVPGHAGAVYSAVYSPDGVTTLTAGADGTVRSHPADARAYLALACAMLAPWPEALQVRDACRATP